MKKIILAISALFALSLAPLFSGCSDEETNEEKYAEWKAANEQWLTEYQAKTNPDGTPFYQTIVRPFDPSVFVLMHKFGDPDANTGNLTPLYNSTIDVRYKLHLLDGTPVDSSTNRTTPAPGVYRAKLNSLVLGWTLALCGNVFCGDSVEIICPCNVGYGSGGSGSILPFSALKFNIRLVDIPFYERPS